MPCGPIEVVYYLSSRAPSPGCPSLPTTASPGPRNPEEYVEDASRSDHRIECLPAGDPGTLGPQPHPGAASGAAGADRAGRRPESGCRRPKTAPTLRTCAVAWPRRWETPLGPARRRPSPPSKSSKSWPSPVSPPEASERPVSHWTPREVAEEAVQRNIVSRISVRTVGAFFKIRRILSRIGPALGSPRRRRTRSGFANRCLPSVPCINRPGRCTSKGCI